LPPYQHQISIHFLLFLFSLLNMPYFHKSTNTYSNWAGIHSFVPFNQEPVLKHWPSLRVKSGSLKKLPYLVRYNLNGEFTSRIIIWYFCTIYSKAIWTIYKNVFVNIPYKLIVMRVFIKRPYFVFYPKLPYFHTILDPMLRWNKMVHSFDLHVH